MTIKENCTAEKTNLILLLTDFTRACASLVGYRFYYSVSRIEPRTLTAYNPGNCHRSKVIFFITRGGLFFSFLKDVNFIKTRR